MSLKQRQVHQHSRARLDHRAHHGQGCTVVRHRGVTAKKNQCLGYCFFAFNFIISVSYIPFFGQLKQKIAVILTQKMSFLAKYKGNWPF